MATHRPVPSDGDSDGAHARRSRSRGEDVAICPRPWPYQGVKRAAAVVGLISTLVLSGAACSKDEPSAVTSTTVPATTSTSASTTTTTSVEEAILAGYRAFWAAYLRAADPMNPEHPDLVATAVNPELEQVQRAFLARLAGGEVIRGTIENHPQIEGTPSETTATVLDCAVDNSRVVNASTGAEQPTTGDNHHLTRVEMSLVDGTWRVRSVTRVSDGCTP